MDSPDRPLSRALQPTICRLQAGPLQVDCVAVGVSAVGGASVQIRDILCLDGEIHDEPDTLQSHCASLLTLWQAVRAPSLIDLDACTCVGRRVLLRQPKPSRRFGIHATLLDPGHLLFAVISSMQRWGDEEYAKAELSALAQQARELYDAMGLPSPSLLRQGHDVRDYEFTAREVQILELLAAGMSNKQIARALGSSPNTVRNQVHAVFRKARVANRTELAVRFTSQSGPAAPR